MPSLYKTARCGLEVQLLAGPGQDSGSGLGLGHWTVVPSPKSCCSLVASSVLESGLFQQDSFGSLFSLATQTATKQQHAIWQPLPRSETPSPSSEAKQKKRVRFSEGPLEDSIRHSGGHPVEGLKRRLRHCVGAVGPIKIAKLSPTEVLEVEAVLSHEESNLYQPSIDRLKRRAGMLPPLKRKARKSPMAKASGALVPTEGSSAEAGQQASGPRTQSCGKSSRRIRRELKRSSALEEGTPSPTKECSGMFKEELSPSSAVALLLGRSC